MNGWSLQRWTGVAGIVGTVIQLVGFVLAFSAGSPPNIDDPARAVTYLKNSSGLIETATLLFFLGFGLIFVFIGGFRALIAGAAPQHEWFATTVFGLGIATLVLAYAGLGVYAAATAEAAAKGDPGTVRTLFTLSGVLAGAPSLVPIAFFLGAGGSAIVTSGALPRWTGWLGWIAAIVVILAAPSLYGGNHPDGFYTADGLVTILGLLPLYIWTLAVSIVVLRSRPAQI